MPMLTPWISTCSTPGQHFDTSWRWRNREIELTINQHKDGDGSRTRSRMTSRRPQGLRSGQRAWKSGSWDNIWTLREELRDLATYLTRSPPCPCSPTSIISLDSEPQRHPQIQPRNSQVPHLDVVPEIRPTGPCAAPMKTSNRSFQLENPPVLQQAPWLVQNHLLPAAYCQARALQGQHSAWCRGQDTSW